MENNTIIMCNKRIYFYIYYLDTALLTQSIDGKYKSIFTCL